uniref:RAE1/2 domain-containing protein n=1 Tax=Romanomermis culicivorax TaxID=13658 RepID=A0A915JMQ5_ROMCU
MKFLEQKEIWNKENESQNFLSFLESQSLTPKLRHYIFFGLANGDKDLNVKEASKFMSKFLNSVGRYGNSPFLWTLYGSGELPQCFCRMCAVYGGVYCLRMPLQALIVNEEQKLISAIITDNKRVNCNQKFVTSRQILQEREFSQDELLVSKTVLITDQSIMNDGKDHISYLNVQLNKDSPSVKILEVSYSGMACPKNLCIVYLSVSYEDESRNDVDDVIKKLFNDANKPRILFRLDFKQKRFRSETCSEDVRLFTNCIQLPLPDNHLDYDNLFDEISGIFARNFENLPFFPEVIDENEEQQIENNDKANPGDQASENSENQVTVDTPESKRIDSHNVL